MSSFHFLDEKLFESVQWCGKHTNNNLVACGYCVGCYVDVRVQILLCSDSFRTRAHS